MANWSAFGFGGYDALLSKIEAHQNKGYAKWMNRENFAWQKKLINYQNQATKSLSLWSAKAMPSATMVGLKTAGLNPLLAAGGNTNIAPMASSASGSMAPTSDITPTALTQAADGELGRMIITGQLGALRTSAKALKSKADADLAYENARKTFFQSAEGQRYIRDRLKIDFGPKTQVEAAMHVRHSAKDVVSDTTSGRRTMLDKVRDIIGVERPNPSSQSSAKRLPSNADSSKTDKPWYTPTRNPSKRMSKPRQRADMIDERNKRLRMFLLH